MPEDQRRYERILVIFFLLSVFALAITKIADTDTWTHLSFGKWIWEHKAIPTTEPFINTSSPMPYTNWLFAFLLYIAYSAFNFAGVILLKAVVITTAFFIIIEDSLRPYRNCFVAIVVTTIILIFSRHRFVERPDILLMVFLSFSIFSLNAYIYDNKKYIYALPLIHLLWANSHSSLPLMLVTFAAFIGGGLLQVLLGKKGLKFADTPTLSQLRIIIYVFIASFIFSLASPYFIDQYTFAVRTVSSGWWKQEVNELMKPTWALTKWPYLLTIFLMLSFIVNKKRLSLINILLVVPFVILSFSALRFIFLLGIVAGPILSRNISSYLESKSLDISTLKRNVVIPVVICLVSCVILVQMNIIVPFGESGKKVGIGIDPAVFPEGALKYMDQMGIDGKVFNVFHWGGYITWRDFPRRSAFVDGRGFVDGNLLEKMMRARGEPLLLDALEKKSGFESVLLDYPKKAIDMDTTDQALSDDQWVLVYWDDLSLVYVKRGGKYASLAEREGYRLIRPANGFYSIRAKLSDATLRFELLNEIKRNIRETGSSRGYAFLGVAYNEMGLYKEAMESFSKVKEGPIDDFRSFAYYGIAYAHEKLNETDEAIKYYKKALALDADAALLYSIGKMYIQKGDKKEAITYLRKALDLNKNMLSIYPLLFSLYQEFGMTDDISKIRKMYSEVLVLNEGEKHFKKGVAAYLGKQFDIALDEFKKSVESNPSNPGAYSNIGYLYYDMGDLHDAFEYQKRALDIDQSFANAHYGLAMIYKRWSDYINERKHLEEYLKNEPAGYYSRRAMAEIAAIKEFTGE